MQSLSKRMAEAVPTNETYSVGGVYKPERVKVHNAILDKLFTPEAVAAATPAPGTKPVFAILGGRAGAGKSWFTKSQDSPLHGGKFLYINNDDFKEALPEYEGWNAGQLHEEASDIASRAHEIAKKLGVNVIFDATLRSMSSAPLINSYRDAGYSTKGYFMHTAPQVSAVRALKRFVHTGRYVPPAYVLSSTGNEKAFDTLAKEMDDWAVYDNNTGGGPVRIAGKRKH